MKDEMKNDVGATGRSPVRRAFEQSRRALRVLREKVFPLRPALSALKIEKISELFGKPRPQIPPRFDPTVNVEAEPCSPEREKIGWVSPEYNVSRCIALNPAMLEENRCVSFFQSSPELESYRVLRSRLLKLASAHGGNTIMVTSAHPGEGKTLTAINLAFTIAMEYHQTVLLVDCDLKSQNIHERLGFASDRGLIDYLLDNRPISEIMVWPRVEKLTLISGGRSVQESSELLGSPRMRALVADMKARYADRYVLFDVPPVLTGADALAFAPHVDHIILVVEAGRTQHDDIRRALDLLPREKILGLVLNRQPSPPLPRYGSKYYGSKKQRNFTAETAENAEKH